MKSEKNMIILVLLFLCLVSFNCNQEVIIKDRKDTVVKIKTFRNNGYEKKSIRRCIRYGVIAEGMSISECSEAINAPFVLDVKLEEDWAIYKSDGYRIWFKGGYASTIKTMQRERLFRTLEYLRKERQRNPIWIR